MGGRHGVAYPEEREDYLWPRQLLSPHRASSEFFYTLGPLSWDALPSRLAISCCSLPASWMPVSHHAHPLLPLGNGMGGLSL